MSGSDGSTGELFAELPEERGVRAELERRVRAHGVRVEERLALLAALDSESGAATLEGRVAELEQRLRAASRRVLGALREDGR